MLIVDYPQDEKTRFAHLERIRRHLGFVRCDRGQRQRLLAHLTIVARSAPRSEPLRRAAHEWLLEQRIVRPRCTTLRDLVATARENGLQQTYYALTRDLSDAQRSRLAGLLVTADASASPDGWLAGGTATMPGTWPLMTIVPSGRAMRTAGTSMSGCGVSTNAARKSNSCGHLRGFLALATFPSELSIRAYARSPSNPRLDPVICPVQRIRYPPLVPDRSVPRRHSPQQQRGTFRGEALTLNAARRQRRFDAVRLRRVVDQHSDLSLRGDRGSELLEQIRVPPERTFRPRDPPRYS
jgi:hypothetical protein